MSQRNLKLQLIFAAIDRTSGSVKGISRQSQKMARELNEARSKLKALQASAKDVTAFRALKRGVADSERAMAEKQRAVDKLARELRSAERPTTALTKKFNAAKRASAQAKKAFGSQQKQLEGLRRKLKAAGLSSDDLVSSERSLRREIDKTNRAIEKRKNKLAQMHKMQARGSKIRGAGLGMTAGITAPVGFLAAQSFEAAMNAQELQSAFDQTFKGNADAMNAWAEATGNAMGRSTSEMQRGANAFGLFFNEVAKPGQAAAMSREFAILAQDLESFHNLRPGQGIEKLRSGLSGEAEPLKALGIMLNETQVKAKAAQMGLKGVNGALTEEQKIMARRALILEKTTNAQGDVIRTMDSTANRLRAAAGASEEFQEAVGTKLLPAVTPLIQKLSQLLDWFNNLSPGWQSAILGIVGLTAVLGPLIIMIGGAVTAFGAIAGVVGVISAPILAIIALVALVVAAIALAGYAIYKNWDAIKAAFWNGVAKVKAAWDWFVSLLSAGFQWLVNMRGRFLDVGKSIVLGIASGIRGAAGSVLSAIKSVITGPVDWVKKALGINSPSRLFMGFGSATGDGMAIGIDRSRRKPFAAMSRMASGVVAAGSIAVGTPATAGPSSGAANAGSAQSPTTLNVTFNIQQRSGENDDQFADRLMKKLEDLLEAKGRRDYGDDD